MRVDAGSELFKEKYGLVACWEKSLYASVSIFNVLLFIIKNGIHSHFFTLYIIIPADKGNKTVFLDRDLYLGKLEQRTSNNISVEGDPAIRLLHEQALHAM